MSISRIVNRINRQDNIDWRTWEAKRVEEALSFFLRKKLCAKADNLKIQYSVFLVSFCKIENNIERILDIIIDKTPGLKTFMCNHSIFNTNIKRVDWLQRFMLKKLMPTDEEVYQQFHPDPVPQDLLDKFSIFDPVQIVLEMDLIKIQYGMWHRDHNKRVLDPINIIYTDFDDIVKQEDVKKEITKYQDIESDPVPVSSEDWLVEDDLPF